MPSLWSLWWRIPAALVAVAVGTLVMVNVINALPHQENPARLMMGAALVYIQQVFFPWLRFPR